MRLLFDEDLSHRLSQLLSDLFPGSAQVRQPDLGQADDRQVWDAAKAGGFAIVLLDADFAELAQLRRLPPKVVWLRCGDQPTQAVANLLRRRAAAILSFNAAPEAACLELY